MPVSNNLTRFELVHRATVRAFGRAGLGHVQVHLGMGVPDLHVGLWAGAEPAALGVQVFGQQFNRVAHGALLKLRSANGHIEGCGR